MKLLKPELCQLRAATPVLVALVFVAALVGCRPDAAVRKAEVIGQGTKATGTPAPNAPQHAADIAPPADAGAIAGTVLFSGKVPAATIDTSMDPACSLGGASDRLPVEQYVVKGGKLANVFIYVKSGPAQAMQAGPVSTAPVVLDQKNCQYVPHVVALMQGGTVEFHNSDPTMHNIHTEPTQVGNETVDISQGPRGAPQSRLFRKPEQMLPVRCNNHPWMNAFINVSQTPYFAVSDADGKFTITGLPPGNYILGAVQEKLGEKTLEVVVPPKGTAKIQLAFKAG